MSGRASLTWNLRLRMWKRHGDSVMARLLDRVLTAAADGRLSVDDETLTRLLSRGAADERPLGWDVRLELDLGGAHHSVEAAEVVSLEPSVSWIDGPSGPLGVVGGRPLRALVTPSHAAQHAVRVRSAGEEELIPFDWLRLHRVERPAPRSIP
jgi:hypothetical protein